MSPGFKLALTCAVLFCMAACSRGGEDVRPAEASPGTAVGPGDVERGRRAFGQCRSCHAVEPDIHRVGPSLAGVLGRPAGALEDYAYSDAMRSSGLTWTPDVIDAYLENPRARVPGTKMSFAGVGDAQRRADIITYLGTLN